MADLIWWSVPATFDFPEYPIEARSCPVCGRPPELDQVWRETLDGEIVCGACWSWGEWHGYIGNVDASYTQLRVTL